MPTYNKLVRDKIPAIIDQTGKKYEVRKLNNDEYIIELKKKAYEELTEFVEAKDRESSLEELAELLEVINAVAVYHGSTLEEINSIRQQKEEKRGSFGEKVFLINVED
ncbi:putative house-cleaning noncanonical NTP pyrophosphatase (MazG superfamily) [Metabacillus crassostreae]|uniref:nucleoside triphosphate pyrophosphohydrolase n=1 Tax=Metabacillus crassostreae TaxID=929098 RepID=UPI00195D1132|nr:putative house-cleaning noncanonical NTP pyrophosphatase (MazG superfamily) [Metabacillus crassostreae]